MCILQLCQQQITTGQTNLVPNLFPLLFCYILKEVFDMNNVDDVIQVISIGLIVAVFLLNTSRFLKAIELCKECLFILKDRAGIKDEKLSESFYKRIYLLMWKACNRIGDNTRAIKYAEKLLLTYRKSGERLAELKLSITLGETYYHQSKYKQAKQLTEKVLLISKEIGDRSGEANCYLNLGAVHGSVGEYEKAREHLKKSLRILKEIGDRNQEATCFLNLGLVHGSVGEYEKARKHFERSLSIQKEIGDRSGEASSYGNLGVVYRSVGEYEKAREHHEKSLSIQKEIGDRRGEASSYENLATVCQSVGEYEKARKHFEKSLSIRKEIGDRSGLARCYLNLGTVYQSFGEYEKAREHLKKSLPVFKEIGDRNGEATCFLNLGAVHGSVGEYEKAKEHFERSLSIRKEIGDRSGEASSYGNLGVVYLPVGEYEKAREHLEKSLLITKEIGDRRGEASSYRSLGTVYESIGEYEKAREHLEKSLSIQQEIGDRSGEASSYESLAIVYRSFGEYEKAREHLEKSLLITKEIGDRSGEATSYGNLGTLYDQLGEYEMGSRYNEKSLFISRKIGDRRKEALCYLIAGAELRSLGKFSKTNEYNKKGLVISTDIGLKEEVASFYRNQGHIELAVGNSIKAKEYYERGLAISKEIGNRAEEAIGYLSLGHFFYKQSECERAEQYIKEALSLSEKIGHIAMQSQSLQIIAHIRMKEGKIQEAISYFLSGIDKCEQMRGSLRDNDKLKISFSDHNIHSYRDLSMLLCATGSPIKALYVSELSRARALADLMLARYSQYSLKNQILADPRTWAGLESIVAKECNRTCLYVSYHSNSIYLWILKAGGAPHFQHIKGNDLIAREGLSQQVEEFFDFRSFGVLPDEICKDGSLQVFQPESKSSEGDSHEGWRLGVESKANQGPKMNLPICYKLIIAPVVNFLEGPEIIIVPDRALYQIPFAALTESGKYLSETFRIRVVPSLTTLKLINESPADYHCQTGALIVGNPEVGEVHFKGKLTNISRLPCAENEAKMIAKKLGVEPVLGQQATKEAILQAMNSVALIHIAAHGDAERGAIALAPSFRIPNGIPQEGLYLLTMTGISKVQLRAKLVVLSCCHSARGQTKAEGAVGIARALLGSGARSVLVALWALDDEATAQLMTHFYNHLVAGESAGESLHKAMKWMRSKGYDVNQWAPFILIGEDVTFDFGTNGKI